MTLTPEEQAAADAAAAGTATADAGAGTGTTTETTPETFTPEYVKELRAEAAKYRTEAKAKDDALKVRENADLSESEKAKKEAKESNERADKAEAELLRTQVATKKKLSPSMAARLVGDTKEALEKDADNLLKDLGPGAAGGGGFDQGAGRGTAVQGSGGGWIGKALAEKRK